MKNLKNSLRWSLRFALKDARASGKRLSLVGLSIVLALASLVALLSFRSSVESEIARSARSLVGADFVASSRQRFNEKALATLKKLGGESAEELSLASMVYVPKTETSRLVSLRAISDNFPLYGNLESDPADASERFHSESGVLIDRALALQLEIAVGDKVTIGESELEVLGLVLKAPGLSEIASSVAPRVYLSTDQLQRTGLIKVGSRVRSTRYYKSELAEQSANDLIEQLRPQLLEEEVNLETLAEKQASLSKLSIQVNEYLSVLAFLALLLGAIGLSGALHYYLGEKRISIAALRCLGAKSSEIAIAFIFQTFVVGTLSIFCGVFIGILLKPAIFILFSSVLPSTLSSDYSILVEPILSAILVAYVILLSFSILPISSLLQIEPLEVLRSSTKQYSLSVRRLILWLLALIGILASALLIIDSSRLAILSSGIALAITMLLYICSLALKYVLRKLRLRGLPFAARQGIANLYRPRNQTATLFLILGLGIFSSCIILLGREVILEKITNSDSAKDANIIAFDVQEDQLKELELLTEDSNLAVLESVPIVSMTLKKVNSVATAKILNSASSGIPRWSLTRTYRSTYRDALTTTEKLIRGRMPSPEEAALAASRDESIPVTIGERISKQLQVDIGDSLSFDIQGIPIDVRIVGVRKIDWQRFRTNFFIVFPSGILEDAPKNFVVAARAPSEEIAANYQKSTVKQFSNISIIDLRLAQSTLNLVFDKIKYAIAFLSGLSILTAALVLLITLLHSRKQREKEYSLLRVLGGSKKQLRLISLVEHTTVALCASLLAVTLSSLLIWVVQVYVFDLDPHIYWKPIIAITLGLVGLVNLIAALSSRAIFSGDLGRVLRT